MSKILTTLEGLHVMSQFLLRYYERQHFNGTNGDDLVNVLASIGIMSDGGTGDPGSWNDWILAIKHALDTENIAKDMEPITDLQTLNAMRKFIEDYCALGTEGNALQNILEDIKPLPDGTIKPLVWKEWLNSIDDVLERGYANVWTSVK